MVGFVGLGLGLMHGDLGGEWKDPCLHVSFARHQYKIDACEAYKLD